MLAKRIIPCLDVKDGMTVKGVNFVNLRSAGDPVELGKRYSDEGADELVYLDITASYEHRKTFVDLVRRNSLTKSRGNLAVRCVLWLLMHVSPMANGCATKKADG